MPLRIHYARFSQACCCLIATTLLSAPAAGQFDPPVFEGHLAAVNGALFTPDGQGVITISADHTARLWDIASGETLREFAAHTGPIYSLDVSADGRYLVTGAQDNTLRLWNVPLRTPLRVLPAHDGVAGGVALSPDGTSAVTVGTDSLVRVHPIASELPELALDAHAGEVTAVAYRADGAMFATADDQGVILLWSPVLDEPQAAIGAHSGAVTALSFHANNQSLYSAGADGMVKTWQLPVVAPRALAGHTEAIRSVALVSNQPLAVTGSADLSVRVFNTQSGELVRELEGIESPVTAVALSPNNALAAGATEDGQVRLWNLADGADRLSVAGHAGPVTGVAFHTDNARFATTSGDGTLRLWQAPLPPVTLSGHAQPLTAAASSPNGQLFATAAADKTVRLWNPAGQAVRTLQGFVKSVNAIAFRPDNAQIATLDATGAIRLWNAADGVEQGGFAAAPGEYTELIYSAAGDALYSLAVNGQLQRWQLPVTAPGALAGHTEAVRAVALVSNQPLAVTGGADQAVRLFNTQTAELVRELAGVASPVTAVAVSPDDALAAGATEDGRVRLWNLADGADRLSVAGLTGPVTDVVFLADNARFATTGADGTFRVWQTPQPPLPLSGHTQPLTGTAASPNGQLFATAAADKTVRLWNPTGEAIRTLQGFVESVTAIAFRPDNAQIATVDATGAIRLWNVADGTEEGGFAAAPGEFSELVYSAAGDALYSLMGDGQLQRWQLPPAAPAVVSGHTAAVSSVALIADGSQIVTGSNDGTVRLWNAANAQQIRALEGQEGAVHSIVLSPDETLIAAAGEDGNVRLWNRADGAAVQTLSGHAGPVQGLAFHPQGELLASAGSDGNIRVRRLGATTTALPGAKAATQVSAVSPDGKRIALGTTAGGQPAVVIRDLATGNVLATLTGHTAAVTSLAFSGNGARLISGSADKSARVWNPADANAPEIVALPEHPGGVLAVALNADGTAALTSGSENIIRHWNPADATEVRTLSGHTQQIVTLQVAGTTLFSGSADGTVRLWNLADGAAVRTLTHGAAVSSTTVSADGAQILSGSADKTAKLWNTADGQLLATLPDAAAAVSSVAIAADLSRVAIGSSDGIRVWTGAGIPTERLESAEPVAGGLQFATDGRSLVLTAKDGTVNQAVLSVEAVLTGHEGAVARVAFVPDGTRLLSGGVDKTLRVWNMEQSALQRTMTGLTEAVMDLAVSTDAGHIAVALADGGVHIWGTPAIITGAAPALPAALHTLQHEEAVHGVGFGSDGTLLATSGADQLVHVWDVSTGRELQRLVGHAAAVNAVRMGADEIVVSAGADNSARVWTISTTRLASGETPPQALAALTGDIPLASVDGATPVIQLWDAAGQPGAQLTGAQAPLQHVLAAADGAQIYAVDAAGRIAAWTLADGALLQQVETGAPVLAGTLSADGGQLAIAHAEQQIQIYDALTLRPLEALSAPGDVSRLALSPDHRTLLVAGAANEGHLLKPSLLSSIDAHEEPATAVALTPNGQFAVTAGEDMSVKQWNLADNELVQSFDGQEAAVSRVTVTPDGTRVIAGGVDGAVRVWNLADGGLQSTIVQDAAVRGLSVSADNTLLATCGDDLLVHVWEVATGKELQRFVGHTAAVNAVRMGADGVVVSAGADNSARVWKVSTTRLPTGENPPRALAALTGDVPLATVDGATPVIQLWDAAGQPGPQLTGAQAPLTHVVAAADGAQIYAVDAEGRMAAWTTADGELLQQVETGDTVLACTLSADGGQLAIAHAEQQIHIYDALTLRPIEELTAPVDAIAITLSPDHRSLLVAGAANEGHLLKPSLLSLIDAHEGPSTDVVITPNGQFALTAGADMLVKQWNLADNQPVRAFEGHEAAVSCVTITPDSTRVVAGNVDGEVRIWNGADGALQSTIAHGAAVHGLSVSADNSRLATCGADKTIRVWDLATGRAVQFFDGHEETVNQVRFAADNRTLVSVADDATGRVWSVSATLQFAAHEGGIHDMQLAPNGGFVATCGADGGLKSWNPANGTLTREFTGMTMPPICLSVRNDSARVAAGAGDGAMTVWNTGADAPLFELAGPAGLSALAFSPDNLKLAAAGEDRVMFFGPPVPAQEGVELEFQQETASEAPLTSLWFSTDNQTVWATNDTGQLAEWAYAAPAPIRQFNHGGAVYGVTINSDGSTIVSCSADQTVRVWDATTGQQRAQLNGHQGPVYTVALSGDAGLALSAGADQTLRLWDVTGGRQLKQISAGEANVYAIDIDAEGQSFATAGADRTVRIYDLATGELTFELPGHPDFVHSITFSPDGTRLLSYGYAGNLIVWDPKEGTELFKAQVGRVGNLATYSPDGTSIVVANGDGTARLFEVPENFR